MALSPAAIDALIIITTEGLKTLSKVARGEEIKDEDLNLETMEQTLKRVKEERGIENAGG